MSYRKCGRVVCANCSPHRITIPRQYIVRAPDELRLSRAGLSDLTGDDDGSGSRFDLYFNPALGGGEEVRVCNPVRRPNYLQQSYISANMYFSVSPTQI